MKKLLTALAVAMIASGAFAELKLDPVFSSNMVLQQKKPITFFGTADKGDTVSVEFNGKTVTVQPDEDRKWKAEFPAMDAGKTNYTVKISDGKKKIELKDVLIGEVWFCSGQSNMAMPIGKKFKRGWSAQNCEDEVKNAKYPEIRYVQQLTVHSFGTGKKLPARYVYSKGWVKCDPEVAHYFSATAYFFGRELYKDLDVPIGLINASYSGSGIHTWISLEGYKNANLTEDLKIIEKYTLDNEGRKEFEKKESERVSDEMRKWHPLFEQAGAEAKAKAQGWEAVDFDDSSWKKATVQKPQKYYIVRWYRTKFELPAWMKDKKLILSMNKAGEKVDIYLNGKRIAGWNADAPESEKKIHLELDPEQMVQNGENVLAVRGEYFCNQKSSSQMYNIITRTALVLNKKKFTLNKNWKMNEEFACTKKETEDKPAPDSFDIPYRSPQFYSNLYNGMAASWTRLPVRGIIWYQGCRNAVLGSSIAREAGRGRDAHYYRLLKALIADWRAKWNDPELPFLIVQLAGFGSNWKHSDPNKPSGFALIRDIQLQMIELPNVGLATAIDIGESNNIHPANKQDVGRRLALEAERIAYGKNIVSRGPLFASAKPEDDVIRVFFKYADNGLKTSDGKTPGAFAIAGEDKKFVWADAKIDGKTVVVSSPKVKAPKYVRYAYAGYRDDCNLQNAGGLPAYPFRSDAIDYSIEKPANR